MKRVAIDLCTCPENGGLEYDLHRKGCSWFNPARPAMLTEVECCAGCPFCTLGDSTAGVRDEYACQCDDGPRRDIPHWDLHLPPPDWCPLRANDHLVTLRVK